MTAHSVVTSHEHQLEEALRGLCDLITKMQCRASEFLPNCEPDAFIDDMFCLLDGPEQRRAQSKAKALLNEEYEQIMLRRELASRSSN